MMMEARVGRCMPALCCLPTDPLELEVLSSDPESGAVSWPQLVGLVGAYTTSGLFGGSSISCATGPANSSTVAVFAVTSVGSEETESLSFFVALVLAFPYG